MKLQYLVLLRKIRNVVIAGIIVGILINSPFVMLDFYHRMTRMSVFEQVRIGTSDQDLHRILEANGLDGIFSRSQMTVRFSDFWRDCSIDIDPHSHRVCGRGIYLHKREPLPTRLWEALRLNRREQSQQFSTGGWRIPSTLIS